MNFNVEEFNIVIQGIVDASNKLEKALKDSAGPIDTLKECIGNQESPSLYQLLENLKVSLEKAANKYSAKKEEFLKELEDYRLYTIDNNDGVFSHINKAYDQIETAIELIDVL